jgi:hypothetical protein
LRLRDWGSLETKRLGGGRRDWRFIEIGRLGKGGEVGEGIREREYGIWGKEFFPSTIFQIPKLEDINLN